MYLTKFLTNAVNMTTESYLRNTQSQMVIIGPQGTRRVLLLECQKLVDLWITTELLNKYLINRVHEARASSTMGN